MSRTTKINIFLSLAMLFQGEASHGGGALLTAVAVLWLLGAVGLALEGAAAWAARKQERRRG